MANLGQILDGKTALVTGGTSGIGRSTAIALAEAGARVVLAGRRTELGEQVTKAITDAGAEAVFQQTDVTNEDQVKRLVDLTVEKFGGLDIAFNNAGVEHTGTAEEFTTEDYRRVFDVNVLGVFLSLKYELPVMKAGGSIINTSSIVGHVGMPGAGIYIASKHAVEGLTKTTALEVAERGIRVNAVSPAAIDTDMIDRFAGMEGEGRENLKSMHPFGRFGKPEEIAAAVVFLASDAASYVSGVSLPVDGAYLAK